MHWPHLAAMNRWVLGFLELSLDEPARAWQALQDVPRTPTWGRLEVVEAVADAVETLVALGRLEAADDLVATLQEDARGHLWAAPAVLRCAALLLLARGEPLEPSPPPKKRRPVSRRLASHSTAAGRCSSPARPCAARGTPARGWEVRGGARSSPGSVRRLGRSGAESELRRASPRPRHDRELTRAERRVAALVADGRTNREVAAQLFITSATVEAHLTRIYRKLGIRSRTELARLVADGRLSLDED